MVGHFNEGDSFGDGKLPQVTNSRRAAIWPRFFSGPADRRIQRLPELTPAAWIAQHSSDSNDRVP
jgi:hypothetical protein